jgi:hypothetical protein
MLCINIFYRRKTLKTTKGFLFGILVIFMTGVIFTSCDTGNGPDDGLPQDIYPTWPEAFLGTWEKQGNSSSTLEFTTFKGIVKDVYSNNKDVYTEYSNVKIGAIKYGLNSISGDEYKLNSSGAPEYWNITINEQGNLVVTIANRSGTTIYTKRP